GGSRQATVVAAPLSVLPGNLAGGRGNGLAAVARCPAAQARSPQPHLHPAGLRLAVVGPGGRYRLVLVGGGLRTSAGGRRPGRCRWPAAIRTGLAGLGRVVVGRPAAV